MKIMIGTSPMDIKLLDDSGAPLGVQVVSFKLELNAMEVPVAHMQVEFFGDKGNEIYLDGVSLDKDGLVLGRTRGSKEA